MKRFFIGWVLLIAACGWAQTPLNDDFTNRIHLVGSVAEFTADITGEVWTVDLSEPCVCNFNYCDGMVWWSWTAQETSAVIIERLEPRLEIFCGLGVFGTTNFSELPTNELCDIDFCGRGQRAVFQAQAGKEYPIALAGIVYTPLIIRLTATNTPVFRVQPRTQTISPGQSALFTSSAIGLKPLHYQWRRDGANIPNATNQMLAFDDCSFTNAGNYCVVVTSATGVSTSSVARLNVSTNAGPRLEALEFGDNTFRFRLNGEEGRRYWLDYSTDLTNWSEYWSGSHFLFNTNDATTVETPVDTTIKFVRASHYLAESEICINNLRQIWFAIREFADDQHRTDGDDVAPNHLRPYLINGKIPECPSDTFHDSYDTWDAITPPTCIIDPEHHIMFDP